MEDNKRDGGCTSLTKGCREISFLRSFPAPRQRGTFPFGILLATLQKSRKTTSMWTLVGYCSNLLKRSLQTSFCRKKSSVICTAWVTFQSDYFKKVFFYNPRDRVNFYSKDFQCSSCPLVAPQQLQTCHRYSTGLHVPA